MSQYNKHTEEQKLEICNKYLSGIGIEQLMKDYHTGRYKISKYLAEMDIPKRNMSQIKKKYYADYHFFDKIDTEQKAYFLGFIYADGCNIRKGLVLQIHPDDIEILESLKVAMAANIKISTGMDSKSHKHARFVIYDEYLSESLSRVGCVPAKTLILAFPTEKQVPNHLIRHFIRGYFDGDGYIGLGKRTTGRDYFGFSITSTHKFLLQIKSYFHSLGIKCQVRKRKGTKVSALQIGGKRHIISAGNYLYKDSSIFLKRKYLVFNEILKAPNGLKMVQAWDSNSNIYREFESISAACKFINTSNSTMTRWCSRQELKKGFLWKFKS